MGAAMTPQIFEHKLNEFMQGKKLIGLGQSGGDNMCYLTIFYEESSIKSKTSKNTDKNLQQNS